MTKKQITRNKQGLGSGFTLLELLVVIGIIGVLVSLAVVAYSSAQKKSRDSRRQADMKSIQGALEVYYSEATSPSFSYPTTCSDAEIYIKSNWPEDPVNDAATGYVYRESCSVDSYYACAKLETGKGNSTAGGPPAWGVGDYYCVSNLQ